MRCTFCESNEQMDEGIPFCEICWQALEKGQTPPMDFQNYFSGDIDGKLKQVDTLLFTLPNNHFLWYLKGHLEHEVGDTKKAVRSLNSSLNYKEGFGDSWIRLGLVYSDLNREDDASDSYEKGLGYPLSDPTNLIEAGVSLLSTGNPRLASRLLERCLDLVPQDDRALVAYGKALVQLGELEGARKVFEKSLVLYPHNEEVLRGMAQMMLRSGDLDTAVEMYSRILDQHPSDFEALLAMGEIHLKRVELNQAFKYYKEVKELDITLSWSGILKFIISTLRELLSRNRNVETYKEDLRKEYDNIGMYLKEIDAKAANAQGPELLGEIESLIRVLESQKMVLKDQSTHYEEFMKRYEKGDPFRAHLEDRVGNLVEHLRAGRQFDAKQVAMELAPFLSEIRTADVKSAGKLKDSVKKRLMELEEVGLAQDEFFRKMEEAASLEKDGNMDGSIYLLKELEVSMEEHWQVQGKKYYESKMREMRELLEKARDQFDTTGLTKLFESFGNLFRKGPLSIKETYLNFLKRYEDDSASFYSKEADRFLKEAQYKMVIMEKEGSDVSKLKATMKRLRSLQQEGGTPKKLFTETYCFLETVTDLELKHKVKSIKDRLTSLDGLLERMEALGLDNELSKNVDPVKKVIERSVQTENFKLAEILTNEVMENVERILWESYLSELKAIYLESKGEVARLKGFNVENPSWNETLSRVQTMLDDNERSGSLMAAVIDLAKVQSDVHGFYLERLPKEIDSKMERCRMLVREGEECGLNMRTESETLRRLLLNVEKISSFEMLEEAVKFSSGLENRIRKELGTKTLETSRDLRLKLEKLSSMGIGQKENMDAVSALNRAEVHLENGNQREAYKMALEAQKLVKGISGRHLKDQLEKEREELKGLMEASNELGIDTSPVEKGLSGSGQDAADVETELARIEKAQEKLRGSIISTVNKGSEAIRKGFSLLMSKSSGYLTEDEVRGVSRELDNIKVQLTTWDLNRLPGTLKRATDILSSMGDRAQERVLLERCSNALETVTDIEDDKVKELKERIKDVISQIRSGAGKGIERTVESLVEEASNIKAALEMQGIENVLADLEELDELSKEAFGSIEGEEFQMDKEEISSVIAGLLERTSGLYTNPEPAMVKEMTERIAMIREAIISLENRWRAKKRLMTLESIGAFEQAKSDPDLERDILEAKESYQKGDFSRFFRTWERVETHLSKPQVKKIKKESEIEDKAMQILVRGRGPRRTDLKESEKGKGRLFGGIKKLAMDMAQKRKLMDGHGEDRASERSGQSPEGTEGKTEGPIPPMERAPDGKTRKHAPGQPRQDLSHSDTFGRVGTVTSEQGISSKETPPARTIDETKIREMVQSSLWGIPDRPETPSPAGADSSPSEAHRPQTDTGDADNGPAAANRAIPPSGGDRDLSGIARIIAGSRIEQLKRSESVALDEGHAGQQSAGKGVWVEKAEEGDGKTTERPKGGDSQLTCMMDEFLELDTSSKARPRDKDANDIKRKLECFFEKLPSNLRIDEARSFYRKGITLMEIDDNAGAVREFRLAISSAIKIGKLHADLSRALRTVRITLDSQKFLGNDFLKAEKLYLKAEESLGQGSLEECAKSIKAIRNILAGQN